MDKNIIDTLPLSHDEKLSKKKREIEEIQRELEEQLEEQYKNTMHSDLNLYREYIQDSVSMQQNFKLLKARQE